MPPSSRPLCLQFLIYFISRISHSEQRFHGVRWGAAMLCTFGTNGLIWRRGGYWNEAMRRTTFLKWRHRAAARQVGITAPGQREGMAWLYHPNLIKGIFQCVPSVVLPFNLIL